MFMGKSRYELISAYRERGSAEAGQLRFDRLEVRQIEMEEELGRLRAGVEFDRKLTTGGGEESL